MSASLRTGPSWTTRSIRINPHSQCAAAIAAERGLPASLLAWLYSLDRRVIPVVSERQGDKCRRLRGRLRQARDAGPACSEYNFGDSEFLMLFLVLVTLRLLRLAAMMNVLRWRLSAHRGSLRLLHRARSGHRLRRRARHVSVGRVTRISPSACWLLPSSIKHHDWWCCPTSRTTFAPRRPCHADRRTVILQMDRCLDAAAARRESRRSFLAADSATRYHDEGPHRHGARPRWPRVDYESDNGNFGVPSADDCVDSTQVAAHALVIVISDQRPASPDGHCGGGRLAGERGIPYPL